MNYGWNCNLLPSSHCSILICTDICSYIVFSSTTDMPYFSTDFETRKKWQKLHTHFVVTHVFFPILKAFLLEHSITLLLAGWLYSKVEVEKCRDQFSLCWA
jgi:hypothetical protein